ncbi:MAG: saccharopine dehydrogenase [Saprospiraceae bacterium]|nr:saccharopine dehydrogenase [Saprospiraceae bacterium]
MKNILVIGAGRSSHVLIEFLLANAEQFRWLVTVADAEPSAAARRINGHKHGLSVWLDVNKPNDRKDLIKRSDLVISLLPAQLHLKVAKDCLLLRKHLLTASYLSPDIESMHDVVQGSGLTFISELGVDPGIDHMSAMRLIEQIKGQGGDIFDFRSYTGGLVAPDSDDNPWHYKITWNPQNVVMAGQGTAQYLDQNKPRFVPGYRVFEHPRIVEVHGFGELEMYPNRDSLLYQTVYGLDNVTNMIRGTLRYPGFCSAWNALVKIGLTESFGMIHNTGGLTYRRLLEGFLPVGNGPLKSRLAQYLGVAVDNEIIHKIEWLGLLSSTSVDLSNGTAAEILLELLLRKWKMTGKDRDVVIMQHEIYYRKNHSDHLKVSTLIYEGESLKKTAMAKLVGWPLGVAAKLLMTGQLDYPGIHRPTNRRVYEPVLDGLQQLGVNFIESDGSEG